MFDLRRLISMGLERLPLRSLIEQIKIKRQTLNQKIGIITPHTIPTLQIRPFRMKRLTRVVGGLRQAGA